MAIQQHPLPQDISSYRFRLIGDMTLKQFASLGACILVAIIVYSLPIPFFFKYPLIFAFILLGIGMAFVPVQGRSLDIWLIAFIKSIYSPTQYTWKRDSNPIQSTETAAPTKENNLATAQPVTNARIEITQSATPTQSQITPQPTSVSQPVASPISVETQPTPVTATPPIPPVATEISSTPLPQTTTTSPTMSENISSSTPITPTPQPQVTPQPAPTPQPDTSPVTPVTPPSINLPIPFTPTAPNTLVGLTLTPSGHILDGVLVEIKKDNLTLRATKSNKLGQFMFARPLDSGLYQILAEKDDATFAPYSLELTGEIVKPLKIQAQ